jgi:NAD(P)-dependent dehydrogenase (short-subunit alcohol dehydrogenase family)
MVPPGSVALVTGAARRLGRAVALRLARGGCRVAVHFRGSRREAASTVAAIRAAGGEARAFRADLARPAAPAALVRAVEKALGPVEVLVNSAGIFPETPFPAGALRDLEDCFALHVRAPWLLARAVAPGMLRRKRGKIVNLGDSWAGRALPRRGPYLASKAALHALTLSLARDLAPSVQVNAVAPGAILLPRGAPASYGKRLARFVPLGRLGTPEEIAEAVAFLVEGPDFVTGEILRVDGGRHLR